MKTVEDAYQQLAQSILEFVGENAWDRARSRTAIYSRMTETSYSRWSCDGEVADDRSPSGKAIIEGSRAALVIRDDLLQATGRRIWGLTFTLYPNGKFNIEYDYNKPEGYEETDDVIAGDEINRSLRGLTSKQSGP